MIGNLIYYEMPKGIIDHRKVKDKTISSNFILSTVSEYFNISIERMKSKTRKRPVVVARQIAIMMLKDYTRNTLSGIADMMGGRDHTTAIHSIKTIKDLAFTNSGYRDDIENLRNRIMLGQ